MARTSNKTASVTNETTQVENPEVVEIQEVNSQMEKKSAHEIVDDIQEIDSDGKAKENIPENVLSLMKLYPQYKEFYVTPKGFVHPAGVPEYLRKGATLYKNIFFNK